MKHINTIIILLALFTLSCDEWQPGLIDNLIFNDDNEWIERDTEDDPTELVDGVCCNDTRPYPLPADVTIRGVINPSGDIDYFSVNVDSASVGQQIVFMGESPFLEFALFDSSLSRFEPVLDTLIFGSGETILSTVVIGAGSRFIIQANGGGNDETGAYNLTWQSLEIGTQLTFYPLNDLSSWLRGEERIIRWDKALIGRVNISLIRGAVVVEHLDRFLDETNIQWAPPQDMESGTGYRLIISLSSSPHIVDITDEFQIF